MKSNLEGLTNDKEILLAFKNKIDDVLKKVMWEITFNPSYIKEQFLSVERFVENSIYKKSKYDPKEAVSNSNNNKSLWFDVQSTKKSFEQKVKDVLDREVDLDELYELNEVFLPVSEGQRKEGDDIISILKRIKNLNDLYELSKIPFELSELKALEPVLRRREAFYVHSLKREIQDCLKNYSFNIKEMADSYFKDDKMTYNNLKLLSELAGIFSISLNGKGEEGSYTEL